MPHTYHVAPHGDDRADGDADHPFASVAQALAASRQAGAAGEKRIILRGGVYYDVTATLTPADSGLAIVAAEGERPVLHGGTLVTGWQPLDKRLYAAALPGVRERQRDFRALIVNGRFAPRARLPRTGFFEHETRFAVRWMSTTAGGWERKPTAEELTTLRYRGEDLGDWLAVENAEITAYHSWDESLAGVASLDSAMRTVRFSTPMGHPPGAFGNQRYVVWNIHEGLHEPGQWYLDRRGGRVVYWPLPGEDMARAQVIAPRAETILRIEGDAEAPVREVELRGLVLSATTTPMIAGGFGAGLLPAALALEHAAECRCAGLAITNVGGHGIKAGHVAGLEVEGCEVASAGAGGIHAGGRGIRIAESHVHDIGLTYPSAIAVRVSGEEHRIAHNEIHHTGYSAVTCSGGPARIEHNRFHHVMQALDDGAAVYVTFCQGIVIRGNVVSETRPGVAHAYYVDEQGKDCVVEENLAVGVAWPLHNHMAHDNVIRHNVCVTPGPMKITFMKCRDFRFEKNVLVAGEDLVVHAPADGIAAMPANILWSRNGRVLERVLTDYAGAEPVPWRVRDGSRLGDPGFLDEARGDFRFQPSSPARELGIPALDVSRAGRHLSAAAGTPGATDPERP